MTMSMRRRTRRSSSDSSRPQRYVRRHQGPCDRRRRHPRHHSRARAGRARAASRPAGLPALRPDLRHLDGRHPGLRPLRPGSAARRAARRALLGGGAVDLRPQPVPADPQRRRAARREVRRRAARPRPPPVPRGQAPRGHEAGPDHPRLRHARPRPLLLQESQGARRARRGRTALGRRARDLRRPDLLRATRAGRPRARRRRRRGPATPPCAPSPRSSRFHPAAEVTLVSLGTGQRTRKRTFAEVRDWGLLEWARPIIDVVFDGVSDAVDYQLTQVLGEGHYWRLQLELTRSQRPPGRRERAEPGGAARAGEGADRRPLGRPRRDRGRALNSIAAQRASPLLAPISERRAPCRPARSRPPSRAHDRVGHAEAALAAVRAVAAKIVVTTRPRPSTIGPPELPEITRPRREVIAPPHRSAAVGVLRSTFGVVPSRPAATS